MACTSRGVHPRPMLFIFIWHEAPLIGLRGYRYRPFQSIGHLIQDSVGLAKLNQCCPPCLTSFRVSSRSW